MPIDVASYEATPFDPVAVEANGDEAAGGDDGLFGGGLRGLLRGLGIGRNGQTARDTLEELIDERDDAEVPINDDERRLLANVLDLRDRAIEDVMLPRADIVAIDVNTGLDEVINVMTREGHSRLPVFRDTLDDALGMVHIRDILAWRGRDADFTIAKVQRRILFVSPSMRVLELLLEMRVTRCHMALVVDEFGGIDGLVTIEDLVEEIVGEIEDEHDRPDEPDLIPLADGRYDADARVEIETLENLLGPVATDEEREDIDTLGGLVFSLAGRVPIRGELITHPTGFEFEILEADPRRVHRLRIRRVDPAGGEADSRT
ncbi:MAG: HlyC/CorC family transporter [Rhodobacterales bacterium]|nr:HlyC/CorC family transporter [Rhodobacterales bacterium]